MSKFSNGDKCFICDQPWVAGKKFQTHHLAWLPVEIERILCFNCHNWCHGRTVFPYSLKPGKKKNLSVEDKHAVAVAPLDFSMRVVAMYMGIRGIKSPEKNTEE